MMDVIYPPHEADSNAGRKCLLGIAGSGQMSQRSSQSYLLEPTHHRFHPQRARKEK